jgi:hypothetical protein
VGHGRGLLKAARIAAKAACDEEGVQGSRMSNSFSSSSAILKLSLSIFTFN